MLVGDSSKRQAGPSSLLALPPHHAPFIDHLVSRPLQSTSSTPCSCSLHALIVPASNIISHICTGKPGKASYTNNGEGEDGRHSRGSSTNKRTAAAWWGPALAGVGGACGRRDEGGTGQWVAAAAVRQPLLPSPATPSSAPWRTPSSSAPAATAGKNRLRKYSFGQLGQKKQAQFSLDSFIFPLGRPRGSTATGPRGLPT